MGVIGVVGGHGGVGASVFAAALAAACPDGAVLIDLDPLGGGVDVLLGIETVRGVRWSGLYCDGGRLDPDELADALPVWHGVTVLACDAPTAAPTPDGLGAVLDAASGLAPVVLDLGRAPSAARAVAVARCDAVVLVAGADVRAVSAALAVRPAIGTACRLVVRPGRGGLPTDRLAQVLDAPVSGRWRAEPGARVAAGGLDPAALRAETHRLCRDLIQGLPR